MEKNSQMDGHHVVKMQCLKVRRVFCKNGLPACSDNVVLRSLAGLVRFEMLRIADKYDIKSMYFFHSNSYERSLVINL